MKKKGRLVEQSSLGSHDLEYVRGMAYKILDEGALPGARSKHSMLFLRLSSSASRQMNSVSF